MNNVKLGFLALENQDYQEAINIFKRAFETKKEADAYYGFGVAHYQLGDIPTARWAFYQALDFKRNHKEAQEYIARIEQMKQHRPASVRGSSFRAVKDHLEVYDGHWKKFFVKGVNIGLGLPGYFPGEFSVKKGTYLKWFKQIFELGANTVRVYTIHPPDFYEALSEFNNTGRKLYLFQEIWTELPEKNDFQDRRFMEGLTSEIRNAVDVIYGSAVLPERPGHAHGTYEYDVSPYLAGFMIGREWEACAVKGYNNHQHRQLRDYQGEFLSITGGTPFEVWVTTICDQLQSHEYQRYRLTHPVTTINWPTLDPLDHPSESTYGNEILLQESGDQEDCENIPIEDSESLDLAKIRVNKGNGFFALYHAYPYYPDFMNNDYPGRENAYRDYLLALKRHHGSQPVLIAEFGVPTSREAAHWQQNGWHHGGHSDVRQGEINGRLMQSIYDAGMAGGILFGWFDEWFKKNWLFLPYELPADRKQCWFNFQDPEENYGLVAMYPGYPRKAVSLASSNDDWRGATVLYKKENNTMPYRFHDGADDARRLKRFSVQHDEGFLYLRLETAGLIDFSKAAYLIGLDTVASGIGERLLPFGTNAVSPVGLTFLIQLAGKERSRVLTTASYDKRLNEKRGTIRPVDSDQGAWVMMLSESNIRRHSKDGKRIFPPHIFSMSKLTFGSLEATSPDYHSLADFFFRDFTIELRIPWGLLNITDPSSLTALWREGKGRTKKTRGVRLLAVSYKPEQGGIAAQHTGLKHNLTDSLPAELTEPNIKSYSWKSWETPLYHTFLKKSYHRYQELLQRIPEA